jgi:flagellar protein FliO/FliZ
MSGNGAAAGYGDMLVTSLLVLGVVCVVAFVAVRLLGRVLATGRARGAHLMDVVARVPLEPRRSLYVVEVAGKTLLVGTSEMGLSVLSELDASEVRSRVASRPTFGDLVKNAWAKRGGLATMPPGEHPSSRDADRATALVASNRVGDDRVGGDRVDGDGAAHSDANEASSIR